MLFEIGDLHRTHKTTHPNGQPMTTQEAQIHYEAQMEASNLLQGVRGYPKRAYIERLNQSGFVLGVRLEGQPRQGITYSKVEV